MICNGWTSRVGALVVVLAAGIGCEKRASAPEPPASPLSRREDAPAPRSTGVIRGRAVLRGDLPKRRKLDTRDLGRTILSEDELVDPEDSGIQNVFVWVSRGGDRAATSGGDVVLGQREYMFRPRVQGAVAGQRLVVTNGDDTTHNVHLRPQRGREVNVTQPGLGRRDEIPLEATGVIHVTCDLHPWMEAWIHVLPHPYFAVTDEHGGFVLPGLPAGEVEVAAWHEVYASQARGLVLEEGETETVEFVFERQR
ncbi:MAG: hypothetical protein HYY16_19285 [Planctomycetes bacterium]|nr:hypothetical protein [Planctomycetota bacterium]